MALLASDRRRKEPLTVNRPHEPASPAEPEPGTLGIGALGMFAALSQAGNMQVVVDAPVGGSDG